VSAWVVELIITVRVEVAVLPAASRIWEGALPYRAGLSLRAWLVRRGCARCAADWLERGARGVIGGDVVDRVGGDLYTVCGFVGACSISRMSPW
jgi:hypothetical protein